MIKTSRYPAIKRVMPIVFIGLGIILAACGLVRPYTITRIVATDYPPTETVNIIHEPPMQKHLVIADFVGREPVSCPEGEDLCTLRAKAKSAGAHAIWVRKKEIYHYPGDWIMVDGRLTRIYPHMTITYTGAFIRYALP